MVKLYSYNSSTEVSLNIITTAAARLSSKESRDSYDTPVHSHYNNTFTVRVTASTNNTMPMHLVR